MRTVTNLYKNIPASLPEELVETLVISSYTRVERIVSDNHSSPSGYWYDQPWHEWICLIQGSATLEFESHENRIHLETGDCLLIKAHERHRVVGTSEKDKTIWLAVHFDSNNDA